MGKGSNKVAQAGSSNKTATAILFPTNFIHFIDGATPNITTGQMFSAGFCKAINIGPLGYYLLPNIFFLNKTDRVSATFFFKTKAQQILDF